MWTSTCQTVQCPQPPVFAFSEQPPVHIHLKTCQCGHVLVRPSVTFSSVFSSLFFELFHKLTSLVHLSSNSSICLPTGKLVHMHASLKICLWIIRMWYKVFLSPGQLTNSQAFSLFHTWKYLSSGWSSILWWPTCLQVHSLWCHAFTFATALSISAGCLQPMIHNSSWAHHLMSFWSFECDGLEFNFGIFKGKRLKGSLEIRRGVDLVPTIREQRNFSGLKSTLLTRRWS